jgi:hypothetical protein
MNEEQIRRAEIATIRATAQKYATAVNDTHHTVARDAYGALLNIVQDLNTQGWKSGWICGENGSTRKRITVFPPGQEPEPRGVFFRPGEGARCYTIYVDREGK